MKAAHSACLPRQPRRVLLALCEVCDDLGLCDVSQTALSRMLSVRQSTVSKCLNLLKNRSYIDILEHPIRRGCMYRLLHEEEKEEDDLPPQTRRVLLALRELCDRKGKCDVPQNALACRLSMHRSTVDRSLKRLERLGYIRIRKHPKDRRRYTYQLLREREAAEKTKVEPMPSVFRWLYNFRPSESNRGKYP